MPDTVWFHIHRKAALRAAAIPYFIYINGRFVGRLSSGGQLNADVPKASCYLIEEKNSLLDGVLFRPEDDISPLFIEVKTAGGWSKPTYPVFLRPASGDFVPLPAAFESIQETYMRKRAESSLSEKERILLRCYEFWISFSDDASLGEVAAHENVAEMLHALRTIGALRLAEFCEKGFHEILGDISLPLESIEDYEEQLSALDEYGLRAFRHENPNFLTDELRMCIAQFIIDK